MVFFAWVSPIRAGCRRYRTRLARAGCLRRRPVTRNRAIVHAGGSIVSALLSIAAPLALAADGDLSVSVVAGGLARASIILTARHGVTVNFEGVPRTAIGIVPMHPPGGFVFTYPASATARQAADAAVDSWNRLVV